MHIIVVGGALNLPAWSYLGLCCPGHGLRRGLANRPLHLVCTERFLESGMTIVQRPPASVVVDAVGVAAAAVVAFV